MLVSLILKLFTIVIILANRYRIPFILIFQITIGPYERSLTCSQLFRKMFDGIVTGSGVTNGYDRDLIQNLL